MKFSAVCFGAVLACVLMGMASGSAAGEDWPQWRGAGADGNWRGPELPNAWPEEGLPQVWRQPIGAGYAGVSVTQGRVYTMDRQTEPREVERVVCFDAATGELLWTHAYTAPYGDLEYGSGPRAAPTVHDGRVYTLGAVGHLHCLDAATGKVLWSIDTQAQLQSQRPRWGFAASPVIYKNIVITHIGADPGGSMVAFDRVTGEEVWRGSDDPAGYCTPIIVEHEANPCSSRGRRCTCMACHPTPARCTGRWSTR